MVSLKFHSPSLSSSNAVAVLHVVPSVTTFANISRIPGQWSTRWVGGQVGVVVVLFGCFVSTSDEVHLAFLAGLILVLKPKCYNGSC